MGVGRFIAGCLVLAAVLVPLAAAGWSLRKRLLPAWSGAPALLVDVLLTVALLTGALQLIGAVGAFARLPAIAACAATGALGVVLSRAIRVDGPPQPEHPPNTVPKGIVAVSVVLVGVVVAQWVAWTSRTFDGGITDYDSLHYHLPLATRFVQDGWVTRLHFTSPDFPNMVHPSNSELLHGLGILAFGRDVLSPIMNLGWMGLALLAAWSAGRPRGVGPLTMAATVVVLTFPVLAVTNAGSALTDIPSLALLLVAVAILFQVPLHRRQVALAAVAAGLAIGMKLTVLPFVVFLSAAVTATALRAARRNLVLWWLGPLVMAGGFWYVRNLARTGSPLPSMKIGVGPLSFPEGRFLIVDRYGDAVAKYLFDGHVWRDSFLPGLHDGFGPLWPAVLLLGALGAVLALASERGVLERAMGVSVLAAAAAYVVTPTTAMGREAGPSLFFLANLRYLAPALLVGLVLLARSTWVRGSVVGAAFMGGAAAVSLAAQAVDDRLPAWPPEHRWIAALAGTFVAASLTLVPSLRQLHRTVLLGGVGIVVVLGVFVGFFVQRRYLDGRYTKDPAFAWAQGLEEERIAVAGFDRQHPFYGADLSNRVQYIGERGPHGAFHAVASCSRWGELLRRGRYTWVVLRMEYGIPTFPELEWTRSDPGAREVPERGGAHIFRFDPGVAAPSCADERHDGFP